jgi:hypothetical protein
MRAAIVTALAALAVGACFEPDLRRATCGTAGECPAGTMCTAGPGSACKAPDALCAAERDATELDCLAAIDRATDAARIVAAERECRVGAAAATFATCCATARDGTCGEAQAPCDARVPALEDKAPADDINDGFTDYAETGAGWTGGSGAYALQLDDERVLWMFGYAFLGPVEGQTRPRSAPLLDSAFVVQSGAGLATINRSPLVVDPGGTGAHYVPGDGVLTATGVDVVFHRSGSAGFEGNVLAHFAGERLDAPAEIHALPSSQGIAWGTSILPSRLSEDGYTYVFGVEDRVGIDGRRYATVARVAGDDLTAPWEFATATGTWSSDERDAGRRLSDIAPAYSVQRAEDKFLMISHDGAPFSPTVVARAACAPEGPFTTSVPVFQTVEGGITGMYQDAEVYTYNARGHADLSHGNQVVMSYNVNGSPDALYSNVTIYRPRYVRLSFFYTGH